jgi:predicted enzyme related to lactoylglutathione lyase
MRNPIGWFEIYVNDMARAQAFYQQVFQHELVKLDSPGMQMMAFSGDPQQEGATGALVHMPGFASGGNSTLVYFRSEDCALEEARVVAAGGRVHKPKTSIGAYGYITLVIDTEGNMIGIHSLN